MLRKVMLAAIGFALLAGPAFGQSQKAKIVASCGSLSYDVRGANDITMDSTGVLCTSAGGGGSSSTPFTPNGNYQTLTATASSSASTALPAGATVAFQNTSTVDVSCVLASGAATATTNKIVVRGGATVFVAVGSNVNTACINQSGAASNVVVLAGGTGLGTNFGGGGGGGGGGAVTMASGAVASGAYSSGAFASGSFSSGAFASGSYASGAFAAGSMVDLLTMRGSLGAGTAAANSMASGGVYNSTPITMTNGQQAAMQFDVNGYQKVTVTNTLASVGNNADDVAAGAGAASPVVSYNYVWDGTNWDRQRPSSAVLNPCETVAQSYAPISITSATTTRIVTPSASNKTYICGLIIVTGAANNVAIVEGTGGTCGTGTAGVIGGTTAANGANFSANGGLVLQAGKTAHAQTAGTNVDLCVITSSAGPYSGGIKYVQAP